MVSDILDHVFFFGDGLGLSLCRLLSQVTVSIVFNAGIVLISRVLNGFFRFLHPFSRQNPPPSNALFLLPFFLGVMR